MKWIKRYGPYLVLYGVAFLWIIPILWMADTAFKPTRDIFSIPPKWIPSHSVSYTHLTLPTKRIV